MKIKNPVWIGILISIILSTCSSPLLARENNTIDSLLQVLHSSLPDTNRVKVMDVLSIQLRRISEYDSALRYAEDALALSKRLSFTKGIINSYNNIGLIHDVQGQYSEALKYYSSSLKLAHKAKDLGALAVSYSNIGVVYDEQGNFAEALKYYSASLGLLSQIGEVKKVAGVYNNIGYIYYQQGLYSVALENYLRCLKAGEKLEDNDLIGASYNNIGNIHSQLGNHKEALAYHQVSLKLKEKAGDKKAVAACNISIAGIYRSLGHLDKAKDIYRSCLKLQYEIGDQSGVAHTLYQIAWIHAELGEYAESERDLLLSKQIAERLGEVRQLAGTLLRLGDLYIKQNRYSEARTWLYVALEKASLTGVKQIIRDAHLGLANVDSAIGNFRGAYSHYKVYVLYRDSIVNKENSEKIVRQLMQHEFSKTEDSLRYNQALTNERLKRQTILTDKQKTTKNYLIGSLVLFAGLSFFAYKNYRTRQQLNLQTLRNKIAADLHDDVGSTLSSISMFSQMAQEQSREVQPLLQTIGDSSRKMLDAMADIVWTINSENDQFEKIIMRMRSFAYELLGAKKIEFRFIADDDVSKINLSMDARKNLYLIFKEATNNLVKYAHASRAIFTLKKEGAQLAMTIRDNGIGFNPVSESGGNGLKNMKKRAREIGANLFIDSMPGNGTTIRLQLSV